MKVDSYTIDSVIQRLQKVNSKRSVSTDAVASDNIRLAIRQLRAYREPVQTDTEPIDIFCV